MIFYHGTGERDYAQAPRPSSRRDNWECAAILSGAASPFRDVDPAAEQPALWVFPPRHLHGWFSSGRSCELFCLHLPRLPQPVPTLIDQHEYLHIPMNSALHAGLQQLDGQLKDLQKTVGRGGEVAAELAGSTIAYWVLRAYGPAGSLAHASNNRMVKQAIAWLNEHLYLGVGVNEVCEALSISTAHFRRLVHQERGVSPRELLAELRLQRVKEYLVSTDESMEVIADACGFASAGSLSTAFMRAFKVRPGAWRRQQV